MDQKIHLLLYIKKCPKIYDVLEISNSNFVDKLGLLCPVVVLVQKCEK